MIWENVGYLWILVLIPLLLTGYIIQKRYIRQLRSNYFSDRLFESLYQGYWKTGKTIQITAFLIGLFLLVFALAGPKIGTEVREIKRQGVNVLVALDLSLSMNVEDVSPSRLQKAKYEVNRLIDKLKGDRTGLIVFTGQAYLQSPFTLDYSALRLFLNIADTDQMPTTTTEFAPALKMSKRTFESVKSESDASNVLLIISDGEDQGESYENEIQELLDLDVQIFTLGIGTPSGGTIPIYNKVNGSLIGYKRDNKGEVVISKLMPNVLRDIAQKGKGEYYQITRGSDGLDGFIQKIDKLQKGEFAKQEYADFKNQYQMLTAAGLVFILLSVLIPAYRKSDK